MADKVNLLTPEQELVVKSNKKKIVVSASAGSGKTFVVVEKLIKLICEEKVPVSKLLVLTFTKAAANELKSRLYTEILNQPSSPFLLEQLDDIMISDISTIDAFCEKVIKRNINKLSLPQNFVILDEKGARGLKNIAFKRAFEEFSSLNSESFENVYFAFKRNSVSLEECMQSMMSFFDSDRNGEKLAKSFADNLSFYHQKACDDLIERMKQGFKKAKKHVENALMLFPSFVALPKGHLQFVEDIENLINVDFNNDFFSICKEIANKKVPALSTAKCDEAAKKELALAKEDALAVYNIAQEQQFISQSMIEDAEKGKLVKQLLEFYFIYQKQYCLLKEKRSALDFADLEKYARILMEDDEVKKSLQQHYDYIIIDEYQDTNRLQESLLKPIAEGGCFIAVGDVKQGIYGFRNASKEIMTQDIEEFSKSVDGEALFLRGNFRTDSRILDFVNKIFEKLMTDESVGIDYKKTSMLEGKNTFLSNSMPAVSIDIVSPNKAISEEMEEDKPDEWAEPYSVKNDQMQSNYKFKEEIMTIASRIERAMQEKIYSPKTKEFRKVEQADIALLFRNRSPLMHECVRFLQEKGFSVNADIKENLLEDSQITLFVALIKLTINLNDDISLAAVMTSPFGKFSLEELASLRRENPEGSFYDIVKSQKDEKTAALFAMIEEFKFNIQVFGLVKSLEKLFDKFDYMEYINAFKDAKHKRLHINKLFATIRAGGVDFNPQELVSLIESSGKEERVVLDGGNSITVTTIHATKGLEYPIVILCGGGESLNKVYNKNYIVTKDFGIGSHLYSYIDNLRLPSPALIAGKFARKEREFVDELMLFYVAMTRAQNHLIIIGNGKESDFSFDNLSKQNTYLKLIFYALGENFTSQVFSQELVENNNATFSVITEVEEINERSESLQESKKNENDNLKEFYEFDYPDKSQCRYSYKNSVTSATKINQLENETSIGEIVFFDEDEEKISNEEKKIREKAIEVGNSYHEALKLINFDLVENINDLEKEFEKTKPFMQEGYSENIDLNLLLKNILLIKNVVGKNLVYKEREFIMESDTFEIGATSKKEEKNKVIVQGIIDLFAMGEKLILIDYKYTSLKDEKKLIERYCGQIQLYKKALVKAFEKDVDEMYLLSLKEGKLIKVN